MVPSVVLQILRALRRISLKRLVQSCRNIWVLLWQSFREHLSLMGKKRSALVPSRQPALSHVDGNGPGEMRSRKDTPIAVPCLPLQPTTMLYSRSMHSLQRSSSDIALQVVPPESSMLHDGSEHYRTGDRLSRGDSVTLASYTENYPSQQTLMVQPSYVNGSRLSLVVPAAPSLRPEGDVVHTGTSGATGFSDGISEKIYPIMPKEVPSSLDCPHYELEAAQKTFVLGELPLGWEQITHPEGQPYFYHAQKRVVTENWIWDEQEMGFIDGFIAQFEDFARSRNLYQPDDTHLVLETVEVNDEIWCGYYYACASTRSLFWLETYNISESLEEVRGDLHPTHIKSLLEYQYWYHWDLFPNVNKPTRATYDLVMNTITDSRTDVRTSEQSTINHTTAELKEMADVVEAASRRWECSNSSWCIGRFMCLLLHDRFLNFHGQWGARLNRSQSIHGREKHQRTWFIKLLSPILFAAPNVHLNAMEELWVDRLTLKSRCEEFFSKLNTQWGEHIVHASILLNANVAFLAIPSNDPSNNTPDVLATRSPAQIASYLSVITSFASMLVALLLVRQHKTKERATVAEFRQYLRGREHPVRGFEELASVYSLPYALLTWGMVTFFLAFMLMCFKISSAVARSIVGISIALITLLILWCIWMAWEETEFQWRRWFKAKLTKNNETNINENDQASSSGLQRLSLWMKDVRHRLEQRNGELNSQV